MTKQGITQVLGRTIKANSLFKSNDTLVVGFSGGADSTALLHLLHTIPGYNFTLIAAHLNHTLRGDESDGDEQFCRDIATGLGIRFESRRVDIKSLAEREKLNLEDAGRQARGKFFDELKQKYDAAGIVLAHHADDQTETVLMRFLRGSGMTGLSGMEYKNHKGCIRPLLDIPGKDLRSWLSEKGIPWREDSSNCDTTFLRNRIRRELIPLLETYNPAIRTSINATAGIIAADDELLHNQALEAYGRICSASASSVQCRIDDLISQHPSLARRIVRLMYREINGSCNNLTKLHCLDCLSLCNSEAANASIALPNGIVARKEYDRLLVSKSSSDHGEFREATIAAPGVWPLWDNLQLAIAETDLAYEASSKNTIIIPSCAAPFPWSVRTFQAGDRMQPCGMTGHKKIKDLFMDLKIPRQERSRIPLFFAQGELFWVAGIRISTSVSADSSTSQRLIITITGGIT